MDEHTAGAAGEDRGSAGTAGERSPGAGSRTHRRVLRTRAGIEDAFVALVLERGIDAVSVEDVAERADVAKATFYAHYHNKEAVLAAVFARLTADLADRLAYRDGPWSRLRRGALTAAFEHAREMADLYRVCLTDPHVRADYTRRLREGAERDIRARLAALGQQPRVPVPVLATAFAGAHVSILEAWLSGTISGTAAQVAAMELDALVGGLAWAQGLSAEEVGLDTGRHQPPRDSADPT